MKMMRKAVSLICAVALILSCVGTGLFSFAAGVDIATDAVAYDNLNGDNQGGMGPVNLNDADEGTRWTGPTTHGSGTSGEWNVWLKWDEVQTFDSVSILWEDCYAKNYSIQKSDDGETWTKIKDMICNGKGWQEVSLDGTHSATYLGIFITEKANEWGVAIWDIKVYDPNVSVYVTDELEKMIEIAEKALGNHGVNAYGYAATAWAEYFDAYLAAVAAFEACDNQPLGVPGYADQAAIDTITANLKNSFYGLLGGGKVEGNLAANGFVFYDDTNLSPYCGGLNCKTLTDGVWFNDSNSYQPESSQGATIYLGLVGTCDINKLNIYGEATGYNMDIYYTTDSIASVVDYNGYAALGWTKLCDTTNDYLTDSYAIESWLSFYEFDFDTAKNVTAIKIVNNNGGWFKLREVQAYGESDSDFHMTEVRGDEIVGTVEEGGQQVPAKFFCTNVTKEALEGKGAIVARYTVTRNGRTISETVNITEAYSGIQLGDLTIRSEDFEGGRAGDYVIGVLFTNVQENDIISVTFNGVGDVIPVGETTATATAPAGNETTEGIKISDLDGDGVIRVACVGDSITAGTNTFNYPMYLAEFLNELSKINGNTYEVKNFGKGSAAVWRRLENTDGNGDGVINEGGEYFWYDSKEYTSSLQYPADVVILQMGTNDSVVNNEDNFPTYFKDHYINYLVKPYQDLGAKVIVSTAPWTYNWFWAGTNTYTRDTQLEIAEELGLDVVDMNKFLEGNYDAFGPDGDVHPNASGYTIMAEAFYKYIFGGETYTVTVDTEAGARVAMLDVITNREYICVADANGVAKYEFVDTDKMYLNVVVTCDGYESSNYNQLIVNGRDTSLDVALTAN